MAGANPFRVFSCFFFLVAKREYTRWPEFRSRKGGAAQHSAVK